MVFHTRSQKINLISPSISNLMSEYNLKINGVVELSEGIIFEFGAVIDDEEIVFDVYYDKYNQFKKLHVDEDYQPTFRENLKQEYFENALIS